MRWRRVSRSPLRGRAVATRKRAYTLKCGTWAAPLTPCLGSSSNKASDMHTRFRNIGFMLVGAVAGVLVSLNFQVFADRVTRSSLPIEELRAFTEVFGEHLEVEADQNAG